MYGEEPVHKLSSKLSQQFDYKPIYTSRENRHFETNIKNIDKNLSATRDVIKNLTNVIDKDFGDYRKKV